MGAYFGSRQSPGRVIKDPKQRALARYLNKKLTIDEIWDVFSMQGEGSLNNDRNWVSLEDLIYEALNYFCKYKGGLYKKIDREESKPYIEIIIKDIRAKVGRDIKESLNRDELQKLCLYFKDEFERAKNSPKLSEEEENLNKIRDMEKSEYVKVETVRETHLRVRRARSSKKHSLEEICKLAPLALTPEISTIILETVETEVTEALESPKTLANNGEAEAIMLSRPARPLRTQFVKNDEKEIIWK